MLGPHPRPLSHAVGEGPGVQDEVNRGLVHRPVHADQPLPYGRGSEDLWHLRL